MPPLAIDVIGSNVRLPAPPSPIPPILPEQQPRAGYISRQPVTRQTQRPFRPHTFVVLIINRRCISCRLYLSARRVVRRSAAAVVERLNVRWELITRTQLICTGNKPSQLLTTGGRRLLAQEFLVVIHTLGYICGISLRLIF